MSKKRILSLVLAVMMLAVCLAVGASAVTEQEILETIYELKDEQMYEEHNNYSFKMWKNISAADGDFNALEDAVYTECDVWGGLDNWYAPDTSIAIIADDYLHPSTSYQPVLVWTAPYDGKIDVYFKYNCPKAGQKNWDDPTKLTFYFDRDEIHTDVTAEAYVEKTFSFNVKAGQQLMWTVNCVNDQSDDTTNLKTKVWYTSVDVNSGLDTDGNDTTVVDTPKIDDTSASDITTAPADNNTTVNNDGTVADTTPDTDKTATGDKGGLSTGAIIGIIVAVVVVAAAVVAVIVVKKKKNQ